MKKNEKYYKNPNIVLGISMIMVIFILMVIGLFYTPCDWELIDVSNKLQSPSWQHILGTDDLGRDILSRLMIGARTSFFIGITVSLLGMLIGVIIGSISGYFGGAVDEIIMKLIDTQMAFPGILIALMMVAVFGGSTKNIIIALAIMSVPKFARITRSGYIKYKNYEFVKAEKARGAGNLRIMYIHILPNLKSELIVTFSMSFASAVMSEAGLSYLGLGGNPKIPSFGKMLSDAQGAIYEYPGYVIAVTLAVTFLVMGFNMTADGIREIKKDKDSKI